MEGGERDKGRKEERAKKHPKKRKAASKMKRGWFIFFQCIRLPLFAFFRSSACLLGWVVGFVSLVVGRGNSFFIHSFVRSSSSCRSKMRGGGRVAAAPWVMGNPRRRAGEDVSTHEEERARPSPSTPSPPPPSKPLMMMNSPAS